jgi:hypothetical protein
MFRLALRHQMLGPAPVGGGFPVAEAFAQFGVAGRFNFGVGPVHENKGVGEMGKSVLCHVVLRSGSSVLQGRDGLEIGHELNGDVTNVGQVREWAGPIAILGPTAVSNRRPPPEKAS